MPGRRRRATSTRSPGGRTAGNGSSRGTTTRTAASRSGTTRTGTARSRATSGRSAGRPDLPTAGPGERVWVLAVPFRAPAPGAVWHAGLSAHVHVGATLPAALAPYDPGPYSYERFVEDELNDAPRPLPAARP